jgi:hypothetical protein
MALEFGMMKHGEIRQAAELATRALITVPLSMKERPWEAGA